MHVSRVRAKGEAEQAGRRWGGGRPLEKCRVDSVVEYLLDFSRLTRAPGPGTYPLQVHTSYSDYKLVPYALEGEASKQRTSYGSTALQSMHTPMHVGNVMANFQ